MEHKCVEQNTTMLEQIAGKLGFYYKNGWESLFEEGAAIQDAVLTDIMALARNSD